MEEQIKMVKGIELEQLQKILPPLCYRWLINIGQSLKEVVGFFLKDAENRSLGYCLYATQRGHQNFCTLLYVQVLPAYQKQGRATRLLSETIPQMRLWGYSHVIFHGEEEDDVRLLEKLQFQKGKTESYMIYKGDTLMHSQMAIHRDKIEPLRKHVQKREALSPLVRKNFRRQLLENGYHVDMEAANSALTRFFVGKGENILGYISFEQNEEGDLMSTDIYLSNSQESYLTIPSILIDVLFDEEKYIKEDTKVYLRMAALQDVKAMEQAFGQPDGIHEMISYVL